MNDQQLDYSRLAAELGGAASSHEPSEAPAEHPHARTFRLVKENAPLVGGAIGAMMTGGASLPVQVAAAAGGGGLASLLRGDSASDALSNGLIEGGTQGVGGLAVKAGKGIARGLMKGTVPKNISKDFSGQVDIHGEMLKRGAFPGVPASKQRFDRLSTAANTERDAAAATVPVMPRSKVIAGLRPEHAEAVRGKSSQLKAATLDHMRTSAREIGPDGLSGPEALTRKDIQQRLSSAAINNPSTAAVAPQLHNAERAAIVSHLRETPRMGAALDESQALMAIKQVMEDATHSNPVTRARIGGVTAAAMSPIGLGVTAHGVNQGAKALSPQMLRALQLAMQEQE